MFGTDGVDNHMQDGIRSSRFGKSTRGAAETAGGFGRGRRRDRRASHAPIAGRHVVCFRSSHRLEGLLVGARAGRG